MFEVVTSHEASTWRIPTILRAASLEVHGAIVGPFLHCRNGAFLQSVFCDRPNHLHPKMREACSISSILLRTTTSSLIPTGQVRSTMSGIQDYRRHHRCYSCNHVSFLFGQRHQAPGKSRAYRSSPGLGTTTNGSLVIAAAQQCNWCQGSRMWHTSKLERFTARIL